MAEVAKHQGQQELSHDTLGQMFLSVSDRSGDSVAYRYFKGSSDCLIDVKYAEVYQLVLAAAGGLHQLGIRAGDRVAIFADDCLEWVVSDLACICSTVLDVPIYGTLTAAQVSFILKDSGSRLIFVSNGEQADKALDACSQISIQVPIIMYESDQDCREGVIPWEVFLEKGYMVLNGLKTSSGTYGDEVLSVAKNRTKPPAAKWTDEESISFGVDNSWYSEVNQFIESIQNNSTIQIGSSSDALDVMKLIDKTYENGINSND